MPHADEQRERELVDLCLKDASRRGPRWRRWVWATARSVDQVLKLKSEQLIEFSWENRLGPGAPFTQESSWEERRSGRSARCS